MYAVKMVMMYLKIGFAETEKGENNSMSETERFPVTNEEYQALRCLFGCISVFQVCRDRGIEKRMKRIGAWRWYRLAQSFTEKAADAFLRSIPPKKLQSIYKDVQSIRMDIYVDGVTGQRRHGRSFFVEEDALNKIAERACVSDCTFCTKKGQDVKRCELRRALIDIVPWDIKTLDGEGHCNLSGELHIFDADKTLPFCETMEELEDEFA